MGCCTCSCILAWILGLAIALKVYLKLRLRRNESNTCLVGKTAIVTGANTGIGYTTALEFAKRGARVILACRNEDKAEDAQRKIVKETQNPNVVYKLVNFTSLESVRAFAKEINETEERIDILVNNAGGGGFGNHYTDDGLQITMQVNHFSPFLLTHLLIDKLKKSAPSRIVNVTSTMANYAFLEVDKLNHFPTDVGPARADSRMYNNSKLCNILCTTELANKLEGTGVTVNALHPGAINTEVFRRVPGVFKVIVDAIASAYFMTPEEGAQTTLYVATSSKVKNANGKLFDNCQEIEMYATARDPHLARRIWEKCEELVKLDASEKI